MFVCFEFFMLVGDIYIMHGIFGKSGSFVNAICYVASEVMQLLLVVERVKADKKAYQKLLALEALKNAFDSSPVIKNAANKLPYKAVNKNYAISNLCSILDLGLGVTSYLSASAQYAYYPNFIGRPKKPTSVTEEPSPNWIDSWMQDIHKIIDKKQYDFGNLNSIRLHYPHLQLLLAYIHGKELLLETCNLMSLNYQDFVGEASTLITKKTNSCGLGLKTKEDLDAQELLNEYEVQGLAKSKFIGEFNRIIDRIKVCLEWSFTESSYFISPKVESNQKEWKDWIGRDLGMQPILSFEVLEEDIKTAMQRGDLALIAERIANALANKVEPTKTSENFMQSEEYQQNLLSPYEVWARSNIMLLDSRYKQDTLNYKTLKRGLGFSIWREQYQKTNKRMPTLDAATKFIQQEIGQPYCIGTAQTIKQSYEAIKSFAKCSHSKDAPSGLVKLMRAQMTRRFLINYPKARFVFAPFNIGYEYFIHDLASKIEALLQLDFSRCSYSNLCKALTLLKSQDTENFDSESLFNQLTELGVQVHGKKEILNINDLNVALATEFSITDIGR